VTTQRGRKDIVELYLKIPAAEIAYVKFIFESYEGIAVVRTIDRREAIIVLMIAADLVAEARGILDALKAEVAWEEVPPPPRSS
jgi:hypothetical protein